MTKITIMIIILIIEIIITNNNDDEYENKNLTDTNIGDNTITLDVSHSSSDGNCDSVSNNEANTYNSSYRVCYFTPCLCICCTSCLYICGCCCACSAGDGFCSCVCLSVDCVHPHDYSYFVFNLCVNVLKCLNVSHLM